MIRAVFFDWFNTLARYDPPREETERRVLAELGFTVPLEKVRPAVAAADKEYFEENTRSPVRKRSREEQARVYSHYQQTVLTILGIDLARNPQLVGAVLTRMQEYTRSMRFVLFDDVTPVLRDLKERRLVLGLLTNFDQDMAPVSRALGIDPYIDFVVTSGEAGEDKPAPAIFLAALKRAAIGPAEAIHIGDQYGVDVVGARGVGIRALLLDRDDASPEVSDCPRLRSLAELKSYLD